MRVSPKRIAREYRQTVNATPGTIFLLLCPVREAEWLDGWQYDMIYSKSGLVEEGAVFSTPSEGEEDTIGIVTKHDSKKHEVEFSRFTPESRTCILKIAVKPKDMNSSYVDISYTYTSITPAGNDFIDNFTEEAFLDAVTFWEESMNYFLKTGKKLKRASAHIVIEGLDHFVTRKRGDVIRLDSNRSRRSKTRPLPSWIYYWTMCRFTDGRRVTLQLAAEQSAQLLNMSKISAPFQISRQTTASYFALLKNIFLIDILPAWHSNRGKRLIKTPRVHMADTGLAAVLLGVTAEQLEANRNCLGHLLESFVYNELRRQASSVAADLNFYHYRDKDQYEVDIVIEQSGGGIVAVEVKAAATVMEKDFKGLKKLQSTVGLAWNIGIVFYDGEMVLPFGEQMYAVPVSALWGNVKNE